MVWGLVPAAGRGERFGGEIPKQLFEVAGRPLLAWTLERLLSCGLAGLSVALPREWLREGVSEILSDSSIHYVAGGATRQESMEACLKVSPEGDGLVLVHDGARPAVAVADVQATISAVRGADGAILGRTLGDTLKRIEGDRVVSTIDRSGLFRAETPQVFRRDVLVKALDQCRQDGFVGTDDSSIVEQLPGVVVRAVAARHPNPKLTEQRDLPLVRALLKGRGSE
jgi:2-C-methyl-D-erythritol 4-phosphate cytidylyltransferase